VTLLSASLLPRQRLATSTEAGDHADADGIRWEDDMVDVK
jgi:hypothetical protein